MKTRLAQERDELLGKLSWVSGEIDRLEAEAQAHRQNKWAIVGALQLIDKLQGDPDGNHSPSDPSDPGPAQTGG